jgi:Esterase-like activity of phytase
MRATIGAIALCLAVHLSIVAQAGWTVTPRNSLSLTVGGVAGIRELSGVTYIGPAGGGLQRFAAIQDDGNQIVQFDVGLAANGAINSATAVSARSIAPNSDYEGIAYTGAARDSVFISEESTPGVREYDLTTGALLQTVALPGVFASIRSNRGLESLTRSPTGGTMWTGNEEALTIDGPLATTSAGTTVRLQKMIDNEVSATSGPQFAYLVEPINPGNDANRRSGLPDLVMLPDETLITLERSFNNSLPPFRSSIYQVDFAGATDVSGAAFAAGLIGQSYTPVGKTLLWSGQVGGIFGNNLEGLALGPQLPGGKWVLLGVIDNANSGANPIVSFELSRSECALTGDYNCNGAVDSADYDLWMGAFGSTALLSADGNANGIVDAADYAVWRDHSGEGAATSASVAVPEPNAACLLAIGVLMMAIVFSSISLRP